MAEEGLKFSRGENFHLQIENCVLVCAAKYTARDCEREVGVIVNGASCLSFSSEKALSQVRVNKTISRWDNKNCCFFAFWLFFRIPGNMAARAALNRRRWVRNLNEFWKFNEVGFLPLVFTAILSSQLCWGRFSIPKIRFHSKQL